MTATVRAAVVARGAGGLRFARRPGCGDNPFPPASNNGSPVSVAGSASIQDAVASMEVGGVRRLLVTDDEGRVIGFLSADDLLDAVASELSGLANALRSGIARESAERGALPPSDPVFLPLGMPGMH